MPVIWLWHPWRQLQGTRFAPGCENKRKRVPNLFLVQKCHRLSFTNFLTRKMRCLPHRDVARRAQLSGTSFFFCLLCLCVTLATLILFQIFSFVVWACRCFWRFTTKNGVCLLDIYILVMSTVQGKLGEDVGDVLFLLLRRANLLMLAETQAAARAVMVSSFLSNRFFFLIYWIISARLFIRSCHWKLCVLKFYF